MVNATPRPLYSRERPGTYCLGDWVGPRAGLDGCGKSRLNRYLIPRPSSPWRVALPPEQSRPRTSHQVGNKIITERERLRNRKAAVRSLPWSPCGGQCVLASFNFLRTSAGWCLTLRCAGNINPLNTELNSICYLLALLGAHHFLHVSRIRVKLLTFRLLMSYIYIWSTHS